MTLLSKEDREELRDAIQAFRNAWVSFTTSNEARNGVLPAAITGKDSPDGWRAYEQSKQVRRTEQKLIGILERFKASTTAVRYQGIIYSIRDAKGSEIGSYRWHVLVQQQDEILNLDWPDNVRMPEVPPGFDSRPVIRKLDASAHL